jgi:hypothetical protein
MEYRIKGNKVVLDQAELSEYIQKKTLELISMGTNLIISLIIVSLLVILNYMMLPYYYLFLPILIPLLGRGFIQSKVDSYLRGLLKELLELT